MTKTQPSPIHIPPAALEAHDRAVAEGRHAPADLIRNHQYCSRCHRFFGIGVQVDAGTFLCPYCAVATGEARWV